MGRKARSGTPSAGSGGGTSQPPAPQPSRQTAPRVNNAHPPSRQPSPAQLGAPSPRPSFPHHPPPARDPKPHSRPGRVPGKELLPGLVRQTRSPLQVGRGDGRGMQGGYRAGEVGALAAAGPPTGSPLFWWKKKRPPGLPPAVWMLQAPHTGHCRRGRSGCGRRRVGSIVLRECPLFPPWALGEGGQKGTEPWAGTLNWGWG